MRSMLVLITPGARDLSQTYAIESQSFVLHTTVVVGQHGIDIMVQREFCCL
jgi:hypothetical protein